MRAKSIRPSLRRGEGVRNDFNGFKTFVDAESENKTEEGQRRYIVLRTIEKNSRKRRGKTSAGLQDKKVAS